MISSIDLISSGSHQRLSSHLNKLSKKKYKIAPNLKKISNIKNHEIYFSPFTSGIYLLPQGILQNNKYEKNEVLKKLLIENLLLLPKDFNKYETMIHNYEDNKANIEKLAIYLSRKCNLACVYCYADAKKEDEIIDFDFIKKAGEKILKKNQKNF